MADPTLFDSQTQTKSGPPHGPLRVYRLAPGLKKVELAA
jgi:hypothetical protein